jgi:hypothetical protein
LLKLYLARSMLRKNCSEMLTADAIQQRRKLRLPALFYASYKTAQ